ncbi:thioesterase family [Pyrenophora seminiperda CCB06]|uniref:Thioesterase family n=1 Tax=Pyrenophora seminiperda CCB06 TaxID=1302712 RepID=A0A3M7MHY7_9PLEO|nr:thioesterase family [Pyrenophora seminiperda CCB06]
MPPLFSVLEVVKTHFNTSLAKQDQPHTIALHVEFLRRTQAGPATFRVDNVKLGRQTSIVHVSMEQDGRKEIIAYATNSNMEAETGFTFDTQYKPLPPIPSVDLAKLERNEDPAWVWSAKMPFAKFRKATAKVKFHFPRSGQAAPSTADEWICFSDGSNFTNSSIGFVSDMFPQLVENFRGEQHGPFWYPTLLLNLDVKKALPPQGVKWLQIRVEIKKVQNGRLDLEVWVHDAKGDLVALSHHVGFVMDASRNTAARRKTDAKI